MNLTKKHFIKIANIVSQLTYKINKQGDIIISDLISKVDLIEALSDFFYSENKNFQRDKFKELCYK